MGNKPQAMKMSISCPYLRFDSALYGRKAWTSLSFYLFIFSVLVKMRLCHLIPGKIFKEDLFLVSNTFFSFLFSITAITKIKLVTYPGSVQEMCEVCDRTRRQTKGSSKTVLINVKRIQKHHNRQKDKKILRNSTVS